MYDRRHFCLGALAVIFSLVHVQYMHDRRMVEPRLNYNGSVKEMNRSEITFDDYELSGGSDEEDDEETCNDDEIDEMDENDLEEYNDE